MPLPGENADGKVNGPSLELIHGASGYFRFLKEMGLSELDFTDASAARIHAWGDPGAGTLQETDCLDNIRQEMKQLGRTVFAGQGPVSARLFLVIDAGDIPKETLTDLFSGASGELLLKILKAMGLGSDSVYVAPLVDRQLPDAGSRAFTPSGGMLEKSLAFVRRQINVVGPECICTLGEVSSRALLGTEDRLENLRGRFHDYCGITVMPTFHPGMLLRNPSRKRDVWEDMKQVMKRLGL